ncbi:helix-turn-helix domain-containing protein [Bradyrhizobium vignae]
MDEFDLDPSVLRAKWASENSPWISVEQIAQTYPVSVRTIRRMEAEGLMPSRTKRGRFLVYRKSEVEKALLVGRRSLRRNTDQGSL